MAKKVIVVLEVPVRSEYDDPATWDWADLIDDEAAVVVSYSPDAAAVLVTGSPVDGIEVQGPFGSADEAVGYAESNETDSWWVAPLKQPDWREPILPDVTAPTERPMW